MRISDWSSDVCSSDLIRQRRFALLPRGGQDTDAFTLMLAGQDIQGINGHRNSTPDQVGNDGCGAPIADDLAFGANLLGEHQADEMRKAACCGNADIAFVWKIGRASGRESGGKA